MNKIISYKSHTIQISQTTNAQFTKIVNIVNGETYQEIVEKAIFAGFESNTRFVYQERLFLNGFLKSVLGFHNKKYKHIPFITFNDEAEYYVFCIINDITFEEQVWFKTAFIRVNIYMASMYVINTSIDFLKIFHPDYLDHQIDYMEQLVSIVAEKHKAEKLKYKCDPNQYISFFYKHQIKCLYHFTSSKNIESIKKNGLLSIRQIQNKNIQSSYVSTEQSRNVDKYKNLSDYIHLSYERDNPMMYVAIAEGRLFDYTILEISLDVLFWRSTKYTNKNVMKSNALITDDLNFLLNIPFEKFHNKNYKYLNETDKEWFKSEILVKDYIPQDLIINEL